MPQITFHPSNITIDASPGTLLSDASRAAGVAIGLPCGGKGVCGQCLVKITSGTVQADPATPDMPNGFALACRSRVGDTPLTIETGACVTSESGQFSVYAEDIKAVEPSLMPTGNPSPLVSSLALTVPEPKQGDGLSDFDRFQRALSNKISVQTLDIPIEILALLPRVLREQDGSVSLRYWLQRETLHVVSLTSAKRLDYGLAIDVGTTTVAAHLVSLETGDLLASATTYNAQIECGLDIISRIHYAKPTHPERLQELQMKALDTINGLIRDMTGGSSVLPEDIVSVSLAGNTTMTQLLLGIIPEYIRLHPYTPAVHGVPVYTAGEIGLCVCRRAPVWIAPSVGSYVGGDIMAGLLCTPLSTENSGRGPILFIDIGTNGEIVLGSDDFLLTCACSAGPAFEGGGIRYGCRASVGAIERVKLDENGAVLSCDTIGGALPVGICGSGAISLTAELFRSGLIDAAGHFTEKAPLTYEEGRKCFLVADGDSGKRITFSETDIDNLIRAKAAVFSACRTLLESVGLTFDDLQRVYVAGGFGRFLDMDCAASIGLLPRLGERMTFLGNSSLTGAYMALISVECRDKVSAITQRTTYMDLSSEPGYMEEYMAALFLPHTTLSFGE